MERKLYVLTRELVGGRRLIGVISEINGKYGFEYRLGGKLPEWFLLIDQFPDVTKIYNDEETRKFVMRFVPPKDFWVIDEILKTHGLNEYNEWELLKAIGKISCGSIDLYYLSEELSESVVVYG